VVKIIGITGSLASGKSTMSNYIVSKNYSLFDSDLEVKKLYGDKIFLDELKQLFPEVFIEQYAIDKKKLATLIFADKVKKISLEHLIHPIVEVKLDSFIKQNHDKNVIFIDVPLLFEVGWNTKCDEIIFVMADRKIALQRYLKRGSDPELFDKIMGNQGDIDSKMKQATYVIVNNDNIINFYDKIDKVIQKIVKTIH